MFKNKDGSYNKVSIILTTGIVVIIIGMIGSSLLQVSEVPSTDIPPALLIIPISITLFMIYRWASARKITKSIPALHDVPQTPVKKIISPDIPTKVIEPDTIQPGINIISLIITVVVAGVVMLIGSTVITTMMPAMPSIPETSSFAATQTTIMDNVGTAFNLLALGIFVGAAGLIIMTLGRLGSNDY